MPPLNKRAVAESRRYGPPIVVIRISRMCRLGVSAFVGFSASVGVIGREMRANPNRIVCRIAWRFQLRCLTMKWA